MSMRETLNDAGNPTQGLLRAKKEGDGLLGEAQGGSHARASERKRRYIQYGIAVYTSGRRPLLRPQEGSLGSIRREAS